jgi:hypothetical protein
MPNIRTFDTPALELRPSEIGVEATAAAARRGGAFYNQAAQAMQTLGQHAGSAIKDAGEAAVKWETHRQISAGAPVMAQMEDSFGEAWKKKINNPDLDPNDPTIAGTFRAGMEPAFDRFRNGFHTEEGRLWAEKRIDDFREQMFHKTSADISNLAAEAVHTNYIKANNLAINTVYNDPSSLEAKFKALETDIEASLASSPTMDPTARARVRRELATTAKENLVEAAIKGAIDTPDVVEGSWRKIADDKRFAPYVDATKIAQYERRERQLRRAEESDKRTAEIQQKRIEQQAALDRSIEYKNRFINAETGEYSFPKNFRAMVLTDPVMQKYPAATHELLREYNEIQSGIKDAKLTTISQNNYRILSGQIRRGEIINDDPIFDAMDKGGLTRTDRDALRKELAEARTPFGATLGKDRDHFMRVFSKIIDGAMNEYGEHSLLGSQRMYQFEMAAQEAEQALRAKGLDPHLAYKPDSEHYFGKPANLERYRVSAQEAMKYKAEIEKSRKAGTPLPELPPIPKTPIRLEVLEPSKAFVPPPNWEWSPSRRQYRDPDGHIYDASGKRIMKAK